MRHRVFIHRQNTSTVNHNILSNILGRYMPLNSKPTPREALFFFFFSFFPLFSNFFLSFFLFNFYVRLNWNGLKAITQTWLEKLVYCLLILDLFGLAHHHHRKFIQWSGSKSQPFRIYRWFLLLKNLYPYHGIVMSH